MIIVDTNVISEVMRARPDPAALRWLDAQESRTLLLASVTLAELLFGIEILAPGARRDDLMARLERTREEFAHRIVPFDEAAAERYAQMAALARAAGRPLALADGYIAATAASRGFAVATRNIGDFVVTGVALIDPWA